ncbi:MAG: mechanosensitive ion channel domain-containing protein [Desulfosalsimonadaceae bacterium]
MKKIEKEENVRNIGRFQPSIFAGLFLAGMVLLSTVAFAQNAAPTKVDALKASIDDVLNNEVKNIDNLKTLFSQAEQLKKNTLTEINAYKIQLPIYNNLLLQSEEAKVEDLEKAWLEARTQAEDINKKIVDLTAKQTGMVPLLGQTREQLASTEKQLLEILSDITLKKETGTVTSRFKKLVTVLKDKERMFEKMDVLYSDMTVPLKEIQQNFSGLSDKLNETITRKKKESLLKRQNFLISIGVKRILDDAKSLTEKLRAATTGEFWKSQFNFIRTSGGIFLVSFILLFFMVIYLAYRIRGYLFRVQDHPGMAERFWSRLTLRVLQRSMFLLGFTLFLYAYDQAGPFQSKTPIMSAVLELLAIWLFSQWCLDAVKQYCGKEATLVSGKPAFYLRLLIQGSRWFSMAYVVLSWLGGSGSAILIVWRVIFEATLYVWSVFFWKVIHALPEISKLPPKLKAAVTSAKSVTSAIIIAGFILELTGYGMLAQYWLVSWGRTLVVVLWSGLCFMVLREWNPKTDQRMESADEATDAPKNSIRWVLVQLSLPAWFTAFIIFLVFAWGGKQAVLLGILSFLQHTFQVGSMRFSLFGFIVAIIIILMTQAISRVWQHVFRKNILQQSGMEEGLQDSVVTISVYVIWSAGILFALNAVGFTATSLTVVLGALGIGLGFGLQAIFNNFISGIILLFERPIQVGDDIEVNGVWARVKEINVRSTIVQTYDNASLIIPNADLISAQVTNWSFKDKRLRRNVEVGVAYGSDVEMVKNTLLEVAENTPRVLKLPKPDVIFKHFGDNALIFLLRFWTRVEYFYAVESDVRFEIDRLFRERNIEIAYPQCDIRIRSGLTLPEGLV